MSVSCYAPNSILHRIRRDKHGQSGTHKQLAQRLRVPLLLGFIFYVHETEKMERVQSAGSEFQNKDTESYYTSKNPTTLQNSFSIFSFTKRT
jgi:hypothetical protein